MPDDQSCVSCGVALAAHIVLCPHCATPVPGTEPPTAVVEDFKTDCANCHALCCSALAFKWPHYDKPAGIPCKHLRDDFACGKWNTLEADGFFACRGFDCYGAGPAATRMVEQACGSNWRDSPAVAEFEFGNFQRIYAAAYEHVVGKPPPKHGDS